MAYDKETMIGSLEICATHDQTALVKGSVSIPRTTSEHDMIKTMISLSEDKMRHCISKTNCKAWLCLYRFEMLACGQSGSVANVGCNNDCDDLEIVIPLSTNYMSNINDGGRQQARISAFPLE